MPDRCPESFSGTALLKSLRDAPPCSRYVVALSGGCDSVSLLYALTQLSARLPQTVVALHVNHQLSSDSGQWEHLCRELCDSLDVPFSSIAVEVNQSSGLGLEAAARDARYSAFESFLWEGDLLLLGHHRDDQAETLLLNLMKGAGIEGLSGMPCSRPVGKAALFRPLLGFSRAQLESYAKAHAVRWIDDPSNLDQTLDRNFVRHSVMPLLRKRFSDPASLIARAAEHCREASVWQGGQTSALLEKYENLDGSLHLASLELSHYEFRLVLRLWLKNHSVVVSKQQLETIIEEVVFAENDRLPVFRLGQCAVARFQHHLCFLAQENRQSLPLSSRVWPLNTDLEIPELGVFLSAETIIRQVRGLTSGDELEVRFRQGGERFRPKSNLHPRKLKDLSQKWGIAPWRRNAIPLIYKGDELIAVVGYAIIDKVFAPHSQ